jgi:hypothetical protein
MILPAAATPRYRSEIAADSAKPSARASYPHRERRAISPEPQHRLENRNLIVVPNSTRAARFNGRAASVKASLATLKNSMSQQGLGLRGDMVAAEARLDTDMQKAQQALDAQNPERARRTLSKPTPK